MYVSSFDNASISIMYSRPSQLDIWKRQLVTIKEQDAPAVA